MRQQNLNWASPVLVFYMRHCIAGMHDKLLMLWFKVTWSTGDEKKEKEGKLGREKESS